MAEDPNILIKAYIQKYFPAKMHLESEAGCLLFIIIVSIQLTFSVVMKVMPTQ